MNPLAFVAIRSDGQRAASPNILEIAVVRAEPFGAQPTDVYTAQIRPLYGAGRSQRDEGAVWLVDAMNHVRSLTRGCVLVAWNADATRDLLDAACYHWELLPLDLSPRNVDLRSLAWPVAIASEKQDDRIETVCEVLGIDFAPGACPLEDVRALAEIYRRVVKHATGLAGLNGDERSIVETITSRIADGRRTYGPWHVDDGRSNPREALAEVMDALNYCAAELVRLSKGGVA